MPQAAMPIAGEILYKEKLSIMTEEKRNRAEIPAEQKPVEEEIIEGEVVEENEAETGEVVSARDEELNRLAEELQQAQTKAKEYFEGWQRERADFANYKRR